MTMDEPKKENPKAAKKSVVTDKKESAVTPSKKTKSKKSLGIQALKFGTLGVLLVIFGVGGFLWYIFYGPRWGTMHYGVCKVFAERWVDFPSTMKVREVEYYRANARVYVSHIDAAGQFNYNVIECEYGKGTLEITRIRIDRKVLSDTDPEAPINPDILRNFNMGLNAILMNPPELLLPKSTRGAPLNDLWQGDG